MANKTGFKTVETSYEDLEEIEEEVRRHRRKIVRVVVIVAAILIAIVAAVQLWNALRTYDSFEVVSSRQQKDGEAIRYDTFQGNMLEYDNDGVVCRDMDGEQVWNQSFEMTSPMVSICGDYLAVYDRTGTSVYIMSTSGLVKRIETATPINRVCIARQGTIAVLMKEDNVSYIKMYKKKGRELAGGEFYGEKGSFPVDIALSEDAKKMAVDMMDVTKGKISSTINFYNFGSVGQNEINNIVGTFTYEDIFISEIMYVGENRLFAVSDSGLLWFDGSQKPSLKKEVKFEQKIQSLFHNEKYVGVTYSDPEKENSWHIKVYDMNGSTVMENDTELAYKKIEFLDNNEVCVRDEMHCELFTIHSIKKFSYTFDKELYKVLSGTDAQNYTFVVSGEVEEVRLR